VSGGNAAFQPKNDSGGKKREKGELVVKGGEGGVCVLKYTVCEGKEATVGAKCGGPAAQKTATTAGGNRERVLPSTVATEAGRRRRISKRKTKRSGNVFYMDEGGVLCAIPPLFPPGHHQSGLRVCASTRGERGREGVKTVVKGFGVKNGAPQVEVLLLKREAAGKRAVHQPLCERIKCV
jgi:hypothetical protein